MRAVSARSIVSSGQGLARSIQWLRAGSGFAYRLAHLTFPRPVIVATAALAFFIA
jgi:hypothetical protein